jgi:hypothetical protein
MVTNETQLDIPGKETTFIKITAEAFDFLGCYAAWR